MDIFITPKIHVICIKDTKFYFDTVFLAKFITDAYLCISKRQKETMKRNTQIFRVLLCFSFLFSFLTIKANDKGYKQGNINDLALIYQGGKHRIDWTPEQFTPYVVHEFADGHKEWLFDGYLFLEFTDGEGLSFATRYSDLNATKADWIWLLDRLFEEGKSLSALDQCIDTHIHEIGKPGFTHKIVLSIPELMPGQKNWGELDGETMDFSIKEHQIKATCWYVDQLAERFKKAKFKHLKLEGYYWLAEDNDLTKDLSVFVANHIHPTGKSFCWIPYWQAKGYNQWKELGFDIAYQQPNHFFNHNIPDKRLDEACISAAKLNMGMELEFDENALYNAKNSSYNRLVAYVDYFERHQVFRRSGIAYYSGNHGFLDMYQSEHPKDQEIMDRLCRLIIDRRSHLQKEPARKHTKVVAHRGFWNTPGSAENSIASLVKADSIGCYGVEFDVWLTADNKLILNHDGWHEGLSVEKSTADVLHALKLSNGEKMPMFEEYLDKAKKTKVKLVLEMKPLSTPERETQAVEQILQMVKEKKLEKRMMYISFSRHVVEEFVRLAPKGTPILYLGNNISPKELHKMGVSGGDYNYWVFPKNTTWLQDLKDLKMISNAWTVNRPDEMQWCIDQEVDYITTDYPCMFMGL